MIEKDIFNKLKDKFATQVIDFVEQEYTDCYANIQPEAIKEICMFLRDEENLEFDYLSDLCGMDYKDSIGVVYHLYSIKHNHYFTLKVKLDRKRPEIESVERVWKCANWHEREAYDMFGIKFIGHPDLQRILCPEDWEGYPLRKDYVAPKEYHGMDATANNG